jgi:hypothetical protein
VEEAKDTLIINSMVVTFLKNERRGEKKKWTLKQESEKVNASVQKKSLLSAASTSPVEMYTCSNTALGRKRKK